MKKNFPRILLAAIIAISAIISLASCDMLPAELQDMLGLGSGECQHPNVDWITDVAATCKLEGKNHSVCSDCGELVEYGTIPVVDHVLGEWEIDYGSTCNKTGVRYKKCSSCKAKVVVEDIPLSTSHNYDFGVCTDCKVAQTASVGLKFTSNGDGTCALSGIGSCTDKSIVVPATSPAGDTVTSVAASAFLDNTSITSVILPDSISSVGDNAFRGCSIGRASVPAPVVASVKNDKLTELVVTGSGTIPESAMYTAAALAKVTINEGVTEIGDSAFSSCLKLSTIVMPESLKIIGASAFARCDSIKRVTIGSGVTTVGDYAFYNSANITTVFIPASVKYIGIGAFVCSAHHNRENPSLLADVEFEVAEGWFATSAPGVGYGTNIEASKLEDNELAASALNSVYGGYYIKRN